MKKRRSLSRDFIGFYTFASGERAPPSVTPQAAYNPRLSDISSSVIPIGLLRLLSLMHRRWFFHNPALHIFSKSFNTSIYALKWCIQQRADGSRLSCLYKVVFAPSQGAYLLHIDRDDPGFNRFLGSTESSPLVPLVLELFPSKTVSALRSFFISYLPQYGRRPI